MKPSYILIPAVLLFISPFTATSAADGAADRDAAIEALRTELADLRARVEKLEADVDLGIAINPARKVKPLPGAAGNPKNWKLLAPGMERDHVRNIIGEPERSKSIRNHEYWYYAEGKVTFYLNRLQEVAHP